MQIRFLFKNSFLWVLLVSVGWICISCSDDSDNFTIGNDFLESQADLRMIDTFSVSLSTVLIDSLPTSYIDSFLLGNYEDDIFGRVSCNGFFEVGLPSNAGNVQDDDYFDSITISLRYTGYFYGDTTREIRLDFYRLTEELELDESGYLYNTSSFAHESTPIATHIFRPTPLAKDSIEITINELVGVELFELMRSNDEIMETENNFLDYFKGIAIVADTNYNGSVVGFNAEEDNIMIRIYGHRIEETTVDLEYDFPLISAEKQFNQILYNFANTSLERITERDVAVPASELDNKSYSQGGIGLMTKVQFPSMNEFLLYENTFILMAELIIKPARQSYNIFDLPDDIYLYNTDKHNSIGDVLIDEEGNVVTPSFYYDENYEDENSYTFDVTNFIKNELSDNYFDTDHGLILTFSFEEYLCSLKRIVFDAGAYSSQLKIYYVNY